MREGSLLMGPTKPWSEALVTFQLHGQSHVCRRQAVEFAEALDTSSERDRGIKDTVMVFDLS